MKTHTAHARASHPAIQVENAQNISHQYLTLIVHRGQKKMIQYITMVKKFPQWT